MTTYDLWTLTDIGELDRRIESDIDDYDGAQEYAQERANDLGRVILITHDGDGNGMDLYYPEDEP